MHEWAVPSLAMVWPAPYDSRNFVFLGKQNMDNLPSSPGISFPKRHLSARRSNSRLAYIKNFQEDSRCRRSADGRPKFQTFVRNTATQHSSSGDCVSLPTLTLLNPSNAEKHSLSFQGRPTKRFTSSTYLSTTRYVVRGSNGYGILRWGVAVVPARLQGATRTSSFGFVATGADDISTPTIEGLHGFIGRTYPRR